MYSEPTYNDILFCIKVPYNSKFDFSAKSLATNIVVLNEGPLTLYTTHFHFFSKMVIFFNRITLKEKFVFCEKVAKTWPKF